MNIYEILGIVASVFSIVGTIIGVYTWNKQRNKAHFMQITRKGDEIKIRGNFKTSEDLLEKEIKDLLS